MIKGKTQQSIYAVRHGERADKHPSNYNGPEFTWYDAPLTQPGHDQAEETAQFLKSQVTMNQKIKLLASPFRRTMQTASHIGRAFQLDSLETFYKICEHASDDDFDSNPLKCLDINKLDRAEYQSRNTFDIPIIYNNYFKDEAMNLYVESDPTERYKSAISDIKQMYKDYDVVIFVTHSPCVDVFCEY